VVVLLAIDERQSSPLKVKEVGQHWTVVSPFWAVVTTPCQAAGQRPGE
jgi:hypothetical protein